MVKSRKGKKIKIVVARCHTVDIEYSIFVIDHCPWRDTKSIATLFPVFSPIHPYGKEREPENEVERIERNVFDCLKITNLSHQRLCASFY